MEVRTRQQFALGLSSKDDLIAQLRDRSFEARQLSTRLVESCRRQREAIAQGDADRLDLEATYLAATAEKLDAIARQAATDLETLHQVHWSLRPFIAYKGAPEGGAA